MTLSRKGLVLAAIQLAIVLSLGAKLLYDRATRPRVWARTQNFDPDLPIRGRYLALRVYLVPEGFAYQSPPPPNQNAWWMNQKWAYLSVRDKRLIGSADGSGSGMWVFIQKNPDGSLSALAQDPVLVFIPETFQMPAARAGDELWVELTLPAKGPPRPIRLAINNAGGFTPLHFN